MPQQCGGRESFRQIEALHIEILMNGAGGSHRHTKPSATIVVKFRSLSSEWNYQVCYSEVRMLQKE